MPVASDAGSEEGSGDGIILPNANATTAATNDTTVACTCRRVRLPRMIDRRIFGRSSSPILAAVLSRADRFISRFPFRLRTTGIIIISSSTRDIALQCYARYVRTSVWRTCPILTDTLFKSSPVNKRPMVVRRSVGPVYCEVLSMRK